MLRLLVYWSFMLASAVASRAGEPISFQDTLDWIDANRSAEANFAPGDVIDRSQLLKLAPFVPEGLLREMDFEGFEATIQASQSFAPHQSYLDATLQFGPQVELREDFSLANHVAGLPFAAERIAAAKPEAAAYMVAWNRVYRWQHQGYMSDAIHFVYLRPGDRAGRNKTVDAALIGGGHVERHLIEQYQRVYLSRVATLADTNYALDVDGSDTLHYKEYLSFSHPFEMRGSTFVIERPLDAFEEDQVNSYLPTERRVRRLSPKERADSFVGSEFTLDDFEGFSGRVLDYEWNFHGEKDVLHVSDIRDEHAKFFGPGSWIASDRWQVRRCYVIEHKPKLADHPYGRKLAFVDRDNFNITMTLVFDRQDVLLKVLTTSYDWPEPANPAGPTPAETVAHWASGVGINVQTHHAGLVWGVVEVPSVEPSHVRRLFSVSNLTGGR